MKVFTIFTALFLVAFLSASSQKTPAAWESTEDFITYNRTIETIRENGRVGIRFNESKGAGMAWLKNKEFTGGTIEFDTRGRDVMQKSFIGIAFHGTGNDQYETVYFRPFNFHSQDPVRKIHAVQYAFEPRFGFEELRNSRKDEFEAAIDPSDISATDWFHVKIQVKDNRIRVFLNNAEKPCLDVETLNPSPAGKKVGYWVGNNSNGDFANLTFSE